MKHIFFTILTTLAFLGCNSQKKVQEQTLFCYIRYDEPIKAIKAEAILQDKSSKSAQEIDGGIRYQGKEMKLSTVVGNSYKYDSSADFLAEHVFEWAGKANNKNAFRMNIDPIKVFSLTEETISKSKPTTLTWVGKALGKGETMVFMWENTSKGLTYPMEVSTSSTQPIIDIPSAKLQTLEPGDWTLYLVRKKLSKDTIAGMPVNGIFEYYSKAIPIKVIE